MTPQERDQLLMRYLGQGLDDSELDELERLLAADSTCARRLAELSLIEQALVSASQQAEFEAWCRTDGASEVLPEAGHLESEDSETVDKIRLRAEMRLRAFLAEEERQRRLAEQARRDRLHPRLDLAALGQRVNRWTRSALWVVVGAAAVLMLFLAVTATRDHLRTQRIVAVLDDSVHARWSEDLQGPDLIKGHPLFLREGFAQLTFKQGAEVLLQAPCDFELTSRNALRLTRGTLTARVPEFARGFTVVTPTSKVIDFGTEFGVRAEDEALLHVFSGKVGLGVRSEGWGAPLRPLTTGTAATVRRDGSVTVESLHDQAPVFTRRLPEGVGCAVPGRYLSLADLVGGGNGFGSGRNETSIDPLTGQWHPEPVPALDLRRASPRPGPGHYVPTPELAFVDGVFVPDGGTGPVQVSSTGHMLTSCPDTVGAFRADLVNGARIIDAEGRTSFIQRNEQTFGDVEHPAIFLHSNLGVTFDLAALRRELPEVRLTDFHSRCGVASPTGGQAWVLLDGEVVFRRTLDRFAWTDVSVTLPARARFLTLMSTDNGNDATLDPDDWITFAEPALGLYFPDPRKEP